MDQGSNEFTRWETFLVDYIVKKIIDEKQLTINEMIIAAKRL